MEDAHFINSVHNRIRTFVTRRGFFPVRLTAFLTGEGAFLFLKTNSEVGSRYVGGRKPEL